MSQQVGQWIMHEYSLDTNLVPKNDDGYMLCGLTKNDHEEKKAEKRRKSIRLGSKERKETDSNSVLLTICICPRIYI
ncbi:hypothetical protein SCA6_003560 [Theobroma cacao]